MSPNQLSPTSCLSSLRPFFDHSFYPILHSLHVLTVSFAFLAFLLFSSPLPFTANIPFFSVTTSGNITYSPLYQPFPYSSVCLSLNSLPLSFLTLSHPVAFSSFKATRKSHLYFCLLILLAGDINLNPGPVPSLNLAHLNTRSVASVTNDLNKPAALLGFISDNNIEILSLSETWLEPDSLPSTLNSITPENYSLLHFLSFPLLTHLKTS